MQVEKGNFDSLCLFVHMFSDLITMHFFISGKYGFLMLDQMLGCDL